MAPSHNFYFFHNHFVPSSVHESSLCSAVTNLSTAASYQIIHALPVVNSWIAPYFNLAGGFTHFSYPQVRLGVHLSSTNHDYVVLKTSPDSLSNIKSVHIYSSSSWVSCLTTVYTKSVCQIICDKTCYLGLQVSIKNIAPYCTSTSGKMIQVFKRNFLSNFIFFLVGGHSRDEIVAYPRITVSPFLMGGGSTAHCCQGRRVKE